MEREYMDYDVVIVGCGPRRFVSRLPVLKQINAELSIVLVEKGSEVGAHILSGAVFEPTALNELFPDWKEVGAPLNTEVKDDNIYVLTENQGLKIPSFFAPQNDAQSG